MQMLPENLYLNFNSCGVYTPTPPVSTPLLILDQILFTSEPDIQK